MLVESLNSLDRSIQDLDGANLLTNATVLELWVNQITSIEQGDFQGLSNLQGLFLFSNQITSIESGAFQGLSNLQYLDLTNNQITSLENGAFQGLNNLQTLFLLGNNIQKLNLTGATFDSFVFESLEGCVFGPFAGITGFCVDSPEITDPDTG